MNEQDYFTEDGDLKEELFNMMSEKNCLTGLDALVYLASMFSGCTHGNYAADTLYNRMKDKNLKIVINQ